MKHIPARVPVVAVATTVALTAVPAIGAGVENAWAEVVASSPAAQAARAANSVEVGDFVLTGDGAAPVENTDYTFSDDVLTLKGGASAAEKKSLTVSLGQDVSSTSQVITIEGSVELTLSNVKIDATASENRTAALSIKENASLSLLLEGENSLASGTGAAGLQLNAESSSLTIDGTGSLFAKGGRMRFFGGGAGIGTAASPDDSVGKLGVTARNITINGGEITAEGNDGAAGIGGGSGSRANGITINGGSVTAYAQGNNAKSAGGAGIGGGSDNLSTGTESQARNIKITGGKVTATGSNKGAGIGCGGEWGHVKSEGGGVAISGGTVSATGGNGAAAIGGSRRGGGHATITGGDLTLTPGSGGYALGMGYNGNIGETKVTVSGGRIKITNGAWLASTNQNKCSITGGKFACTNGSCIGYKSVYDTAVSSGYGVAFNREADKDQYPYIVKPCGTITSPKFQHGESQSLTYGDLITQLGEGAKATQPDQTDVSGNIELYYREPDQSSPTWGANWNRVTEDTVLDALATGKAYDFRILVEQQDTPDGQGNVYAPMWLDAKLTINAKNLEASMFDDISSVTYNAADQTPTLSIAEDERRLMDEEDFTVAYRNNKNVGAATATITGKGNYTGEAEKTFDINKAPLTLKANDTTVAFDGDPEYSYTATGLQGGEIGNDVLRDVQYTCSYEKGVTRAGENLPITISATADNYEITPQPGMLHVVASAAEFEYADTYKGEEKSSEFTYGDTITVKAKLTWTGEEDEPSARTLDDGAKALGSMRLRYKGTFISDPVPMEADGTCTLEYDTSKRLVPVGEENQITVHFSSDGSIADASRDAAAFSLSPRTLTADMLSVSDVTYNGSAQEPAVTKAAGAEALLHEADFQAASYSNNTHAATRDAEGHPAVTVRAVAAEEGGFYAGEAELPFAIDPAEATVTVNNKSVAVGGELPSLDYQVAGLFNEDSLAKTSGEDPVTLTCDYDKESSGVGDIAIKATVDKAKVNPDYTVQEPIVDGTLTVLQSEADIEADSFDEKGDQRDVFTYGDTIVIEATANPTGEAVGGGETRTLSAMFADGGDDEPLTMAVCDEAGEVLCPAVEVQRGAEHEFLLDTQDAKDVLTPGENTLKVVLTGDDDMAETEKELVVTVAPRPINDVALSGNASKVYDGSAALPEGHSLALSSASILEDDEVSLGGTFSFASEAAGTKTVNASQLALSGGDSAWYTLGEEDVSCEVQDGIAKRPVTVTANNAEVAVGGDLPDLGYSIQKAEGTEGLLEGESLGESIVCSVEDSYGKDTAKAGQTFTITPSGAANGNYSIAYETGTLAVKQSTSMMEYVKSYNNEREMRNFTYGDTITVKAKPVATGEMAAKNALAAAPAATPEAGQMALYCDYNGDGVDEQISEAVSAGADGVYTMTYETVDRKIAVADDIRIIAKFVANDDLADCQGTVEVNLKAKQLTDDMLAVEDGLVYTGKPQEPTVSVADPDGLLVEGDYTVGAWSNNTHAGTGTASVSGQGFFTGTVQKEFTIDPAPLTITARDLVVAVGGTPQYTFTADFLGTDTIDSLTGDLAYECEFCDDTSVGKYPINFKKGCVSSGDYTISFKSGTLTVVQSTTDLTDVKTLNGEQQTDSFTYGDTITVQARPKPTGEVPEEPEKQAEKVSLSAAADEAAGEGAGADDAAAGDGTDGAAADDAAADGADVAGINEIEGEGVVPAADEVAAYPKGKMALFYGDTNDDANRLTEWVTPDDSDLYTMNFQISGDKLPVQDDVVLTAHFTGNDDMTSEEQTILVDIAPKQVTASALGEATKVYDGTDSLTGGSLSLTLAGVLDVDKENVRAEAQWKYADKKAGTTTAVGEQVTLQGAAASHYALADDASVQASVAGITKKPLSVTAVRALDKVDNDSADATIASVQLVGLVPGEMLELGTDYTATGTFEDAEPGENKVVTAKIQLSDTEKASNYTLETPEFKTKASIEARSVSGEKVLPGEGGHMGDGDDVTVVVPEGSKEAQDGGIDLPEGGKVKLPGDDLDIDGTGDVEVELPEGSHIGPDGVVDLPEGGQVELPGEDGFPGGADGVSVAPAGEGATVNPDGSVDLPEGGTVTRPDGVVEAPAGSKVLPDGTIVYPEGEQVMLPGEDNQLGGDQAADDVAVTPGEGGASFNPDGSVTLPGGGTVDGPHSAGATVPGGTVVNPDGSASVPEGGQVVLPGADDALGGTDDVKVEATEGGATINPDGSVTLPDGGKVVRPDGTFEVPAGSSVLPDGTIVYPENGQIALPGEDGQLGGDHATDDVTVTPGEGGASFNPDGSVTLPGGGTVDGPHSAGATVPGGTVVNPDGSADIPAGGEVVLPGKDGGLGGGDDVTVEAPEGGAVLNPDGSVTLPEGGKVTRPDGVVEAPAGSKVLPDGTIVYPEGGQVVLPGEDGQPGTEDDVTIAVPEGSQLTPDGSVTLPGGEVVLPGEGGQLEDGDDVEIGLPEGSQIDPDGSISVPEDGQITLPGEDGQLGGDHEADDVTVTPGEGGATVNPDGSIELPEGGKVTRPDGVVEAPAGSKVLPDGTIVYPEGGSITLPGEDGQAGGEHAADDVEVVPGEGGASFNPDGSVTLPDGGKVVRPDGTFEVPAGSKVLPDGTIVYPEGGSVTLPGEDGQTGGEHAADDVTVTPDEGSASLNPDGSVTLPGGGTVEGPHSGGATVPGGTVVNPDGSASVPEGGQVTLPGEDGALGGDDDVRVEAPEGEGAQLNPDGSVTLPGGGTVVRPDGTVEAPAGSVVLPDGTIVYPEGGQVVLPGEDGVLGGGDDVTVEVPEGGASFNPDGSVSLPEGGAVTRPDGTFEAPAGSEVLPDGTIVYPEGAQVTLPGEDGQAGTEDDVAVAVPDGSHLNPDGSVTLPGGEVVLPGGDGDLGSADDVTADLPEGSQIDPDGSISVPEGEIVLPGGDGQLGGADDVTVTVPEGGATVNPDGSVDLPEGGTVTRPDGVVEAPAGSKVLPDGTIVYPEGGSVTLPGEDGQTGGEHAADDVTVTPGEGGASLNPDGSVTLPGGGAVDGPHSGGATVPGGTVVYPDGSADIPAGGQVSLPGKDGQLGGADDVTVLLPEGEGAILNPDGSVSLPGGGTVVRPDGTVEAPAGSRVLPDGTIVYPGDDSIMPLPSAGSDSKTLASTGDGTGAAAGAAALGVAGGLAALFAALRRRFSRR